MEKIEELKQEIELLQKKLELLKLIDELQGKLNIPQKEYIPYPVYPDYWRPVIYRGTGTPWWDYYPPIVTCDTVTVTSVIPEKDVQIYNCAITTATDAVWNNAKS